MNLLTENWIKVEFRLNYDIPNNYTEPQAHPFLDKIAQAMIGVIDGCKDVIAISGTNRAIYGNINPVIGRHGKHPTDAMHEGIKRDMEYHYEGKHPFYTIVFTANYSPEDFLVDRNKLINIESDLLKYFKLEQQPFKQEFTIKDNTVYINWELTLMNLIFRFSKLAELNNINKEVLKNCFGMEYAQLWTDIKKNWDKYPDNLKHFFNQMNNLNKK